MSFTAVTFSVNVQLFFTLLSNSCLMIFEFAFLYDNRTFPSPSFSLITSAVILSPTLNVSLGSSFSLNENSFLGIIPSALYPKSTKISP